MITGGARPLSLGSYNAEQCCLAERGVVGFLVLGGNEAAYSSVSAEGVSIAGYAAIASLEDLAGWEL